MLRLGVEPRSEPSLAGRTLAYDLRADAYDTRAAGRARHRRRAAATGRAQWHGHRRGRERTRQSAGPRARRGRRHGRLRPGDGDASVLGSCDAGMAHVGTGSYEALTAPLDSADHRHRAARGWLVDGSRGGRFGCLVHDGELAGWRRCCAGWRRARATHGRLVPMPSPARLLREMPDGPARLLALSGSGRRALGAMVGMDLGLPPR